MGRVVACRADGCVGAGTDDGRAHGGNGGGSGERGSSLHGTAVLAARDERAIDFQDALLAPRLYDVASLLTDRTTPRLVSPADERRLVVEFADLCGGHAHWRDEATLLAEYRTVALQRALKVVGRFNYLAEVKGKPGYLTMLPAAAATAERLLG